MDGEIQGHNIDTSTPIAEVAGSGVVPGSAAPTEILAPGDAQKVPPQTEDTRDAIHVTPVTPPVQETIQSTESNDLGYAIDEISDASIQGVAKIFQDAGIKSEDALKFFTKALDTNSVDDIDTAGIVKALGPGVGDMVVAVVKGVFYENNKRTEATTAKFMQVIGGEEAWGHIKQWVHDQESKDSSFKTMIDNYRELLDKDESSALLVANALKSMYRDANVTRKPSAFVQGDPRAAAIGVSPILDITEFGRMYSKAMRENNSDEAAQILARWRVGGGKGKK